MNNIIYFTQAIYKLYPNVVSTSGNIAYDAEGNEVTYDPVTVQQEADKLSCADQAKAILTATDWTSIGDVGDPAKANPYLVNQAEFVAYRSTVRGYAVNPVVDPVFPTQPSEQWSTPDGAQ
jgi:hypothetical protein